MIDYGRLDRALTYYKEKGFERIESPWTVTRGVSDITRPSFATDWYIEGKDKVLVASGEQSFLYLGLKGFLPPGKFVTVTPCFRDDSFDLLHTKYFMKAELINTASAGRLDLLEMVDQAYEFFAGELNSKEHLEIVRTDDQSYDIEWKKCELGSYGIRFCPFLKWVYGTAVAEPRFSTVKGL